MIEEELLKPIKFNIAATMTITPTMDDLIELATDEGIEGDEPTEAELTAARDLLIQQIKDETPDSEEFDTINITVEGE